MAELKIKNAKLLLKRSCCHLWKLKMPVIRRNSLYERQISSISFHQASSRIRAWRRTPPRGSLQSSTFKQHCLPVICFASQWRNNFIKNIIILGSSFFILDNTPIPIQSTLKSDAFFSPYEHIPNGHLQLSPCGSRRREMRNLERERLHLKGEVGVATLKGERVEEVAL